MKTQFMFCLFLTAFSAVADSDWNRYEIIVNRAPFGREPLPEVSAEPARPAGEFAKQYRLCMLYEDALGQLKAGLVSKVNNKNFFLQVGESEKGLSLLEVRLEEGIAVLQQGGETAQLILEGLGTPAAVPAPQGSAVALSASSAQPQQFRRTGSDAISEQIRSSLTDSSPKQPHIMIAAVAGGGAEELTAADTEISIRPPAVKRHSTGTYLVQSVPKRYNPF